MGGVLNKVFRMFRRDALKSAKPVKRTVVFKPDQLICLLIDVSRCPRKVSALTKLISRYAEGEENMRPDCFDSFIALAIGDGRLKKYPNNIVGPKNLFPVIGTLVPPVINDDMGSLALPEVIDLTMDPVSSALEPQEVKLATQPEVDGIGDMSSEGSQ